MSRVRQTSSTRLAAARCLFLAVCTALLSPVLAEDAPSLMSPGDLASKVYRLDHAAEHGAVVDGDTIRLADLPSRVRLVCVDTEEVFRNDRDEDAANEDFAAYSAKMQGDRTQPVKYGTPMGTRATEFARKFFDGVEEALLVPDDAEQLTGYYGRNLGYLLVDRDGDGVFEDNFNLALVEQGMSPYFVKYGRSLLWDEAFAQAESRARESKLGVWNPEPAAGAEHYPDYEARLEWWHRRSDCLDHFKERHADEPDTIRLGIDDSMEKLAASKGKKVTIFGSLYVSRRDDGDTRLSLSHRRGQDVFLDGELEVSNSISIDECEGQFVYARGQLIEREGKGYRLMLGGAGNVWMDPDPGGAERAPADEKE